MKPLARVGVVSVLWAFGAFCASQAQTVTCENAQYDPALLEKYPNLPKSCLDIITRDGQDYAVVKARLDRVNPTGSVVVRIRQPDGTYGKRTTLRTPPNMRVLVDGRTVSVQDLAANQQVTAYVKVHEPAMALAPAEESAPLVTTPLDEAETQAEEEMAQALPATSSMLPLIGLLGGSLVIAGGLLSAIRYRRR